MNDRITCFKLNWYDCGLSCAEDAVQEEITIYRNHHRLVFKELNGYGVICSCQIIQIDSSKVQKFFAFLEKTYTEWESDYIVEVCDGSRWEVRMWHSSHKVKKVCGTVEYPPHGKKIERFIRSFIDAGNGAFEPILFGCG
jgi:hypothetical protein